MRYFREVHLSEICYLHEAIDWIVFGNFPEELVGERALVRANTSETCDGWAMEENPVGEKAFKLTGESATYEEYLFAFSESYKSLDELINGNKWEREDPRFDDLLSEFRAYGPINPNDEGIKQRLLLDRVDNFFAPLRTKAQVALLNSILHEELIAYGLPAPDDLRLYEGEHDREDAVKIPLSAWTTVSDFWMLDPTIETLNGFWHVFVSTNQLFQYFPHPMIKATPIEGEFFDGYIATRALSETKSSSPKPRGRSPRSAPVQEIVCNQLRKLFTSGHFESTTKKEAIYLELENWCSETLLVKVGRSSIQRWVAPVISAQK